MPTCHHCGCYVENDPSEEETPLMRALRALIDEEIHKPRSKAPAQAAQERGEP